MMDLGGASVSGPRPYNEDAYYFVDLTEHATALAGLTAFAVVSDGMGGHESGDVASRVAVEAARTYVNDLVEMAERSRIDLDIAQALREIASEAHQAVQRATAERGGSSMGATFVAAFMTADAVWVGHVGDSRAYLIHDGGARPVTVDHSEVGRMIFEGALTEEQAQHHPQRNVIERALGLEGATAEITHVEIRSGDALLLCSDGVSTVLGSTDIADIAPRGTSAQDAARLLTEEAVQAGALDNATAVLVCDDWSLFRAHTPRRSASPRHATRAWRDAERRHKTSRTSMILGAVALLAVVGIMAAVVLSLRPSANERTGASAESTATNSTATPSANSTRSVDLSAAEGDRSYSPNATIKPGTNLRVAASTNETAVVEVGSGAGAQTYVDSAVPMKDAAGALWYKVPRSEMRRLLEEGTVLARNGYAPETLPEFGWVREDRFDRGTVAP